MVNDFREYAKLPQAKLSALDLNNFLSEIAQLYQEAGTSIKLDFEKNIPLIEGDPAQLRQVLHNLIKNSIDAAEGEDPGIVIQTRHIVTDSGMNAVQLHLHDNGVGFSENILNRAFEPYITTKPTGTGLGLPMVKKILDEHRAVIRLSIGQIRAAPSSMAHKLTFSSSTLQLSAARIIPRRFPITTSSIAHQKNDRYPHRRRRTRHTQHPVGNSG